MSWLAETPQAVVDAHMEMMTRIKGEESQTATAEVAVGRSMKPGYWVKRQWAKWKSAARGRALAARAATPLDVQSFGIGYREVKSNG